MPTAEPHSSAQASLNEDRGLHELNLLFAAALALLLLTELCGLTGGVHAPHEFLSLDPNRHSPFFAFSVAAIFALHALFHARQPHLAAAFAVGLIFTALHAVLFFPAGGYWLLMASTALYYLGVGSFVMLCWLGWCHRGSPQGRALTDTLKAGVVLPLFVMVSWSWLEASYVLRENTFDAILYRFDDSLGFQASALAARWFGRYPLLANAGGAIYAGLPLFAAIQYGLQCKRGKPSANILKVFFLIALAGFAVYFLFPAAGPRYLLGAAFPDRVPGVEHMPMALVPLGPAYRNAMPSLHMAWALALCFGARDLSLPVRAGFALVAWGTALATLGLGEHYLIDLVVAFPFALAAHALCIARPSRETRGIAAMAIAVTTAWLAYLSTGVVLFAHVGGAHWAAIAITLGLVWALRGRLDVKRH